MDKIISDDAIKKATGKDWSAWISFLIDNDGCDKTHKELVKILKDAGVSPWWQQSIAGQFEKDIQGRQMHEMPSGFQATASRTINTAAKKIFDNFDNGDAVWLPDGKIMITTQKSPHTIRGAWSGSAAGRVDAYITEKGKHKSQISINHTKISDAATCDKLKHAWRAALTDLKKSLET